MSLPPRTRRFVALLVLASTAIAAAETAVITGVSRIYLRTGPGTTYEPDGVVVANEPVTVLGKTGSWVKIETQDRRTGFVYGGYLTFQEGGAAVPVIAAPPPPPLSLSAPSAEPASVEPQAEAPSAPSSGPPSTASGSTAEGEAWQSEVADLKAEIARLRTEMEQSGSQRPRRNTDALAASLSALPTRKPFEIASPEAESSNLRTAGIALLSLVIGWVFGAGFARRRGRPQRGRLRF